MLVRKDQLKAVFELLGSSDRLAIDTETTGLSPYSGAEIFSLIIATCSKEYYFNFNKVSDHLCSIPLKCYQLDKKEVNELFNSMSEKLLFAHNFKFDAHFLANEGFDIMKHNWHDTMTMQLLINNREPKLGLADLAEKLDIVKQYISKNKLYFNEVAEGKKTSKRNEFYSLVPLDTIVPYGLQDARACYDLGSKQIAQIKCEDVYRNEMGVSKVLFEMERIGVKIDLDYTELAAEFELHTSDKHKEEFQRMSGKDDPENRGQLISALIAAGETLPSTEKGAPKSDKKTLESLKTDLGQTIIKHRFHKKRYATYFKNFLDLADSGGVIHCSYRQNVATGRMGCSSPNLQNLTKEEI